LWFAGASLERAVPVAALAPLVGLTAVNADGRFRGVDVLTAGIARSLASGGQAP